LSSRTPCAMAGIGNAAVATPVPVAPIKSFRRFIVSPPRIGP